MKLLHSNIEWGYRCRLFIIDLKYWVKQKAIFLKKKIWKLDHKFKSTRKRKHTNELSNFLCWRSINNNFWKEWLRKKHRKKFWLRIINIDVVKLNTETKYKNMECFVESFLRLKRMGRIILPRVKIKTFWWSL